MLLEQDIILFARNKAFLKIEEIMAILDYKHIIEKIHAKHLYLTEEVLIPSTSTGYEAHIMTYLNNVFPNKKYFNYYRSVLIS